MNSAVTPELQAAFDRERGSARVKKTTDAAEARAQTVRRYGRLSALQGDLIARGSVPVACERGCSFCCHLRVEIRPHEVFVLAQHIQTKFSPAQRAHVMTRLEENLKRLSALSKEQHIRAGIPCALLEEGACSVYEARPATCRKY